MTRIPFFLALGALTAQLAACSGTDPDHTDSVSTDDTDVVDDGWRNIQAGLDVRDTVVGDGAEVLSNSTITAHYTLWLYEDDAKGQEIESSRSGSPFTAPLGQGRLIQGWEIGIPGMHAGGVRELIIGPDLAYGSAGGGGGRIPPNATLFFEVEIVSVD